ncbi:hypothetical protein PCI56_01030 [Plesiomonas shigelloides subsp. oncorhynchi]|nr:hypothetical protein [Plesiomonas shigelloides]
MKIGNYDDRRAKTNRYRISKCDNQKAQETGLSPLFQLCEKYFGRIHVAAIIDGTDMTYTGELPRKTKRVPALEQSNPEGLPNDQSYRGRAPAD